MYRAITILLLLFSLAVCSTVFAQQECYRKYKKRGDDAMRIKKWEDAIKHYEAARRCDIDSVKYQEEVERLIDSSYKLWVRELEAAKKESNDFISFLTVNFADENCKNGNYNEAFSVLQIGNNNSFDKIISYQKILLPYLSDRCFENIIKIRLFTRGSTSYAAVLEKEIGRPAAKRTKQKTSDDEGQDDQKKDEAGEEKPKQKKELVSLQLTFYDISGTTIEKIASFGNIINSAKEVYMNLKGDEITLITDNKVMFFEIQPSSILKRGEISYKEATPTTSADLPQPALRDGYKKINEQLLNSDLLASFSDLQFDTTDNQQAAIFTLKITNIKTGETLLQMDSVSNFEYFPDLYYLAIMKHAPPHKMLTFNLRTREKMFVADRIESYNFPYIKNDYTISLTIDTSSGTMSSEYSRLLIKKTKTLTYDMSIQGVKSMLATGSYNSVTKGYIIKTKTAYLSYESFPVRLAVYDTLLKFKSSFKVSNYSYLPARDKVLILEMKPYTPDSTRRQDTLKIINPERTDSTVFTAEKIMLMQPDSLFMISDKSGTRIFYYGGTGTIEPIQFPNKKIVYASSAPIRGYMIIQAENINAKRNDTVTILYSTKTKSSIYEMPGKGYAMDMIGDYATSSFCVYAPAPNTNQQNFLVFDTVTRKTQLITLNPNRLASGEISFVHYYAPKNLFLICFVPYFADLVDEETLNEAKSTPSEILKLSPIKIQIYNLSTGQSETIYTRVEIDQNDFQIDGNYLVLTGYSNLLTYDDNVKNGYFYNLHLFGKERTDYYKKMHKSSIERFKKKVYADDKTE